MTMPHLMNCPHRGDGWCLDCVKDLGEQLIALSGELQDAQNTIAFLNHEIDCLNGDAEYGN